MNILCIILLLFAYFDGDNIGNLPSAPTPAPAPAPAPAPVESKIAHNATQAKDLLRILSVSEVSSVSKVFNALDRRTVPDLDSIEPDNDRNLSILQSRQDINDNSDTDVDFPSLAGVFRSRDLQLSASNISQLPRRRNISTEDLNASELPTTTGSLLSEGILSQGHRSSAHQLFGRFSFKGIGFSIEKSALRWNTIGLGIRLPITPNFPEYDRNVALPRIGAFFACFYPYEYKLTISASLTLTTVVFGLVTAAKGVGIMPVGMFERIKRIKPSGSVQRIGFSLQLKYKPLSGLKWAVGPSIAYIPSLIVVQRLLPYLYLLPAVLLSAVSFLVSFMALFVNQTTEIAEPGELLARTSDLGDLSRTAIEKGNDMSGEPTSRSALEGNNGTESSLCKNNRKVETEGPPTAAASPEFPLAVGHNDSTEGLAFSEDMRSLGKKKRAHRRLRLRGFRHWHQQLLMWSSTKTTALQYSLGFYKSPRDTTPSSNLVFDMQPFFPLLKTWRSLRRWLAGVTQNKCDFTAPSVSSSTLARSVGATIAEDIADPRDAGSVLSKERTRTDGREDVRGRRTGGKKNKDTKKRREGGVDEGVGLATDEISVRRREVLRPDMKKI